MNEHSALRTLLRKNIRACDVALEKCQPQCQPQIQYICYICIFAAFAYCIFATNLLHSQHSIRISDEKFDDIIDEKVRHRICVKLMLFQ